MRLIANTQLTGDYGTVVEGQEFNVNDENDAKQLISRGMARRASPPRILYQTKPARFETPTIQAEAPGVSARDPFLYGALPNPQQTGVATEGDHVLASANVSEPRTADSGGRRGRKGSGSR